MSNNFAGKRVLLIAPKFFGYEADIHREIERRGAQVDFIPDRPFSSSWLKAIARVYRPAVTIYSERAMDRRIREICGSAPYDVVLVIIGEGLTENHIRTLRILNPKARFVLYMWDSFDNKKFVRRNLRHFDAASTFDREDAKAYGMQFRPLFYVPGFDQDATQAIKYEVSFIGTAHSDRYRIVHNLQAALPKNARTFFYLYLQAPWVFIVRRVFDRNLSGSKRNEFRFDPIPKSKVQEVFSHSFAILDIEHPKQTGLTMRTFEAIGARKKLITTNQDVINYDFYHPNNILICQRNKALQIPAGFFDKPYQELDKALRYKYSVAGWIDEVLGAQ